MKNEETSRRDDETFEQSLRAQSVKQIPAAWREEILRVAEPAANSRPPSPVPRHSPWWRELFWPCPQAWAALAAVWLLILGQSVFSRESSPQTLARLAAPPSPETRALLKQQNLLFAELVGPQDKPHADRPKPSVLQPRSARREKCLNA